MNRMDSETAFKSCLKFLVKAQYVIISHLKFSNTITDSCMNLIRELDLEQTCSLGQLSRYGIYEEILVLRIISDGSSGSRLDGTCHNAYISNNPWQLSNV